MASPKKGLKALDASTGKKFGLPTDGMAARRGLLLNKEDKSKIYFSQQNLISIYANNGKYVKRFGKKGKIKLKNIAKLHLLLLKIKLS